MELVDAVGQARGTGLESVVDVISSSDRCVPRRPCPTRRGRRWLPLHLLSAPRRVDDFRIAARGADCPSTHVGSTIHVRQGLEAHQGYIGNES
jgi:hypothetical protein